MIIRFALSSLRSTLVFLLLTFGLTACGQRTDSEVISDQTAGATLKLQRCPDLQGRAECGQLTVAENPEDPNGRAIALNIVRIPAIASGPEPDPVFVLVGGPGEAATDLRLRMPPLFNRLNRERDIVLVDQRGTGKSNPLDCKPLDSADFGLTSQEGIALQVKRMSECLEGYDADLRFYTTPFAVDDIDAVRQALGYKKINLWGGSYGSRAALVYLRRHPDSVRSVILDSVAPFPIQLPVHAAVDADRALEKILAHCRAQAACADTFGNLETKTRSLVKRLDDHPQRVELEHPLHQRPVAVHVDGQLVAGLIRLAVYQRDMGPLLPLAIDAASENDFRPLMVLLMLSEQVADSLSLGLQQTILCAEDIMRPRPVVDDHHNSLLQLDLLSHLRSQCESWPKGLLPDNYFEPVHSDRPVLLLSGELDPVTPPRWADVAAQTLSNSRHLRVPGGHHIVSHLGCVRNIAERFIEQASHESLAIDCLDSVKPLPPFVSPAGPVMDAMEVAE